jgi:alkanesulfonate monooxygenase SsuD/methylene tetrahydromethanopterin reductase-like flavin-dependent oxidoreductase (luciferase family)
MSPVVVSSSGWVPAGTSANTPPTASRSTTSRRAWRSSTTASYADEYNTAFATLDEVRERRARIVEACAAIGREPIPFSLMTPVVIGRDEEDLRARVAHAAPFRGMDADAVRGAAAGGWIVGTLEQAAAQLRELAAAGVSRVLCQHGPADDLDFVEIIGRELAPMVA